jgi:hypothetical protein
MVVSTGFAAAVVKDDFTQGGLVPRRRGHEKWQAATSRF